MSRADPLGAMIEAQRGTALLWAPVAMALGIAAYFALRHEPAALWLWAGAGLSVLFLLTGHGFRIVLISLLALAILGFVRAGHQTRAVAEPVLERVYYGPVAGRVVGLDRSASNRVRILLDRVHLPGEDVVPTQVRLVLRTTPSPEILRPGAEVMTTARLTPPPTPAEPGGFDFRRHAWFAGLGAIGSAPNPVLLQRPGGDRDGIGLFALRIAMADHIRARMPERTGAFAAAILTGDRSQIVPEDLINLRRSNLAHLLAISGLHMGLLTGFVFLVFRTAFALVPGLALRVPTKKVAAVLALLAGLGYLMISGASVATQRAFIMAAVVLVAVLLDRPALTLRAVAVAALIVLAIRPESLLGPGFQMSFAATIALIWCFQILRMMAFWQNLTRGWARALRAVLVVVITSAVAGAATAPFAAFHFNQVPQYGLIANVLAVPAMGMLVMPSAVLALVLTPIGLDWIGYGLMDAGIAHILNVADRVTSWDGAVLSEPTAQSWVLGAFTLAALMMVIPRGRLRSVGALAAAATLLVWAGQDRPDVLISESGRLVGVMSDQGRILSRGRGDGFVARVWLENDGDPVSQSTANARSDPDSGATRIGPALIHVIAKDAPISTCGPDDVVILPADHPKADLACLHFDPQTLRRTGATALHIGEKLRVVTVSDVSGKRPWTGHWPQARGQ